MHRSIAVGPQSEPVGIMWAEVADAHRVVEGSAGGERADAEGCDAAGDGDDRRAEP